MYIIKRFSTETKLPIKINTIIDVILERGFVNKIRLHPIEEEPEYGNVPGIMLRRRDLTPYATGEIVDIVYSTAWPEPLKRLGVAKELIHTTMDDTTWTRSRDQVSRLTQGISRPMSALVELAKIAPQLVVDHSGLLMAMALLIPMEARSLLLPAYKAGKIGDEEIAALAEVPEIFVDMVMADDWEIIGEALCK